MPSDGRLPSIDPRPALLLICAALWLIPVSALIESSAQQQPPAEPDTATLAWDSCRAAVRGTLLVPDSAVFDEEPELRRIGERHYFIRGHVDIENVEGETVRNRFDCRARRLGDAWSATVVDIRPETAVAHLTDGPGR